MSLWRVVNPGLNPPHIAVETGDEQTALRAYAAREGQRELHKSEDDGKTWAKVEAREPDPLPETTAKSSSGASSGAARGQVETEEDEEEVFTKAKPDKREKASK